MGAFGGYLILFGIGSIILNQFDMEFRLLMWIDMWGTATGWGIRVGMIVLGALLLFLGRGASSDE